MDFLPIRVSTLRGDQTIDFDVFIKLSDKYVLYCRKGDSFEGPRLTRLKSKKLKQMFIVPNDEPNYRNYMSKNIAMAYDQKSGKDLATRAEVIQGHQQAVAEAVMQNPESQEAYSEAKDAAGKFAQFIQQEDQALSKIMSFENLDQNIAHHGVNVASLAVALAKKLGTTDSKVIQILSLGSLLHDFDHFHNGLSIARPLSQFTADEMKIYKQHPVSGAQRVQDKKHFDQQVLNIISQHEEYMDGSGFPLKLPEAKLDPLALIVGCSNALDRMISFEGVPKKEAAKKLMMEAVGKYPLNYIQNLGSIMSSINT